MTAPAPSAAPDFFKSVFKAAAISDCERYRYQLYRVWDAALPQVFFIMLNPSTADAETDDPTIRRCTGFARSWGYGGIEIGNLFALRATDPKDLASAQDPVGPANDMHLAAMAKRAVAATGRAICAWGNQGGMGQRDAEVLRLLQAHHAEPYCLRINRATGMPAHPLYLPKGLEPTPY